MFDTSSKIKITQTQVFLSILNFSNKKIKHLLKSKNNRSSLDIGVLSNEKNIYKMKNIPKEEIDKEIEKNEEIIKQFEIRNAAMKMIRDDKL